MSDPYDEENSYLLRTCVCGDPGSSNIVHSTTDPCFVLPVKRLPDVASNWMEDRNLVLVMRTEHYFQDGQLFDENGQVPRDQWPLVRRVDLVPGRMLTREEVAEIIKHYTS